MKILIKRHTHTLPLPTSHGDWIDLCAAETVHMKTGEYRCISLGVSMKLPKGYEAIVAPRSSTFKHFGILLVNGIGIIDNAFCGEDDVWGFLALAVRDTTVHKGDRICQFRIQKTQPPIRFVEVLEMSDANRGGVGSTGVK